MHKFVYMAPLNTELLIISITAAWNVMSYESILFQMDGLAEKERITNPNPI